MHRRTSSCLELKMMRVTTGLEQPQNTRGAVLMGYRAIDRDKVRIEHTRGDAGTIYDLERRTVTRGGSVQYCVGVYVVMV